MILEKIKNLYAKVNTSERRLLIILSLWIISLVFSKNVLSMNLAVIIFGTYVVIYGISSLPTMNKEIKKGTTKIIAMTLVSLVMLYFAAIVISIILTYLNKIF